MKIIDLEMREFYETHQWSVRKISKEFGVSHSTVGRRLDAMGVKRRSAGERRSAEERRRLAEEPVSFVGPKSGYRPLMTEAQIADIYQGARYE